jgi:serine protease Do
MEHHGKPLAFNELARVDDAEPRPDRRRRLGAALAGCAFLAFAVPAAAAPAPESFSELASKVTPMVVTVSSERAVTGPEQGMPELPFEIPEGSPFEEFFRQFRDQRPQPMTGTGSGFIVDPTGYIVTNNHVIDGASGIEVTLDNGKEYAAKLIGVDEKTDLAVIKIDAPEPLPAATWGDSDAVKVGDWVVAVGNPFGLGGTITAGILSARGRDIHAGPFDDFLQVDASINRGNSGGPLFSTDGRVIGVNTAIASPHGGSVGIGFAIPSNLAKPVVEALRQHGVVERGWLGVQIQTVTPEIASAVGLERPMGALVTEVQPDSPAARSGLRQGDVILTFAGQDVAEMRLLPRMVAAAAIGKPAELTVWRDGRQSRISVEIGKLPAAAQLAERTDEPVTSEQGTATALGLTLAEITPATQRRFNIPDGVSGVVVVAVAHDSFAAEQGLEPGDVIQQVAQKAVRTPEEVVALAEAARAERREALLLLINRGGDARFVAVRLA